MGKCRILRKLDAHNAELLFIMIQKRRCRLLTETLFVENPDYVTVCDSESSWVVSRLHLITACPGHLSDTVGFRK